MLSFLSTPAARLLEIGSSRDIVPLIPILIYIDTYHNIMFLGKKFVYFAYRFASLLYNFTDAIFTDVVQLS